MKKDRSQKAVPSYKAHAFVDFATPITELSGKRGIESSLWVIPGAGRIHSVLLRLLIFLDLELTQEPCGGMFAAKT